MHRLVVAAGRLVVVLSFAAALAACSTTYGKMGFTGGVAAAPIANDTYRISASGNGYTDATTIQDFALLKAAETTLDAGKTHFTIVGDRDSTDVSSQSTGGSFNNWGGGFITYNPGVNYNIVKPGQDLMIRVWTPKAKDALPPNTFRAQEVFDNINPRVKRSKDG